MGLKDGFIPLGLTSDKLADVLDKTQWATGFEWAEIAQMAQSMRAYTIAQNTILWQEGDLEHYFGIIVKGRVDILKSDMKGGEDSKIATLGRGQSLGEMCLIDREPRSAKAVVADDLTLLLFNGADLNRLRDEHPLVAYKLLWKLATMLSQRLRKTSGQLVDFLCVSAIS